MTNGNRSRSMTGNENEWLIIARDAYDTGQLIFCPMVYASPGVTTADKHDLGPFLAAVEVIGWRLEQITTGGYENNHLYALFRRSE